MRAAIRECSDTNLSSRHYWTRNTWKFFVCACGYLYYSHDFGSISFHCLLLPKDIIVLLFTFMVLHSPTDFFLVWRPLQMVAVQLVKFCSVDDHLHFVESFPSKGAQTILIEAWVPFSIANVSQSDQSKPRWNHYYSGRLDRIQK